jgi:hypothetical protein
MEKRWRAWHRLYVCLYSRNVSSNDHVRTLVSVTNNHCTFSLTHTTHAHTPFHPRPLPLLLSPPISRMPRCTVC